MDVRCPSCGTDYELDDTRVPETGLPVKCSKCGHVFRALKPSAQANGGPSKNVTGIHAAATEWMIRRTTGEMVRFRELTTLQRWIVERKVSRNDEISKTGKKWEKLGNIPELAIFFQVIESQGQAIETPAPSELTPSDTPAVPPAPEPQPAPEPADWQTAPPPAIATPVKQSWPVDKPWHRADSAPPLAANPPPPPDATDPNRPIAPYRTGPDPLSETLPDPTGINPTVPIPRIEPPPPAEPGEVRQETVRWDMAPNLPDEVREEYEVGSRPGRAVREESGVGKRPGARDPLPKRSSAGQVIMILMALVIGLLAIAYVLRPAWITSMYRRYIAGVPPAAMKSVDEAYAALLLDTGASIDTAVEKLEAALGLDGSYAPARAGLAEALAARVDASRELADLRASAAQAAAGVDPAPELAAVGELRRKADSDLERARAEASEALAIDSAGLASNRAMLDVVRLSGDKTRIDQLAMVAHAAGPNDARLNIVLAATVLTEPAAAERVQKQLEAALAVEPKANHARYLMAKLHVARNERDKAIAVLKELTAATPAHERAVALLKSLEGPATAEQPMTDKPTTDTPSPDGQSPITDGRLPNTDKPNTETPKGPKAADDPSLTFAEAMARGEKLREGAKPGQAVRFYERAAALNPQDPDAHLGVGFCRLDLREANAAINAFRKAIDISPRFSDAHFGIAEAYRIRGNKLYAIKSYKTYLDIAPHGPDSETARAQLAKLEDDNSDAPPLQPSPPTPSQPEPPTPPGQ